jgi:hypothetical protein
MVKPPAAIDGTDFDKRPVTSHDEVKAAFAQVSANAPTQANLRVAAG